MTDITSSSAYTQLHKRTCAKGKHRPYENVFGVTWCVVCGSILSGGVQSDPTTHMPDNKYRPLSISKHPDGFEVTML